MATNPFDSRASTVLILGIVGLVGLVLCPPAMFCAPVGWVMGNSLRKDAAAAGYPEPGNAATGRVLSIIGTVLLALGLLALIAVIGVGVATSSTSGY